MSDSFNADDNTFYQGLWWEGKTKPKSVPVIHKVEVEVGLPGMGVNRYTVVYHWSNRLHRVTREVNDDEDWKLTLAHELTKDFMKRYPEDARKAFDPA